MKLLNPFERTLCHYTSKLFLMAKRDGFDIVHFIEAYMRCKVPELLDRRAYRYGGSGAGYLYEETLDEFTPVPDNGVNQRYGDGVIEWAGYTYRLWNWYTGEPSKDIIKICPAQCMLDNWFYGHTIDPELFIEDMHSGSA